MTDQITIVKILPLEEKQRKHKYSPNIVVHFRYKKALLFIPFYATKGFQEDTLVFDEHVKSLCSDNAERIYKKGM